MRVLLMSDGTEDARTGRFGWNVKNSSTSCKLPGQAICSSVVVYLAGDPFGVENPENTTSSHVRTRWFRRLRKSFPTVGSGAGLMSRKLSSRGEKSPAKS